MLETRQTIINSIHDYIKSYGGRYTDWRIGICAAQDSQTLDIPATARDTLFLRQARSDEDATTIMAYFVYIYDVVRDKRLMAFEGCDVVYLYRPPREGGSET